MPRFTALQTRQRKALAGRKKRIRTRVKWFGDKVQKGIKVGMAARLKIAGQLLRDMTVANISRPVTKKKGKLSGRIQVVPSSRSKPGEFPKADTTRLMKDIYSEMRGKDKVIVGTTLDYGLVLEIRMKRSFLRRTLRQSSRLLTKILIKGTGSTAQFPGEVK